MNKIYNKIGVFLLIFLNTLAITAQNETKKDSTLVIENKVEESLNKTKPDSTKTTSLRKKIDGIAAVVGDYIVLESDIDKAFLDLKNQGVSTEGYTRCQLVGNLMETKLYTHHAIQDSLPFQESQVQQQVSQQIAYMKENLGDEKKILEFYRQENMDDLEKELLEIGKIRTLSNAMQQKVIEEVKITPDEVKTFFKKIPEDDRPLISTEVEIAQIVIKPKPSVKEIKATIDELNQMRKDILENGSSFATKAVLYSQDPGSRSNGGKYTLSRKDPFAKEFKDNAFGLQEGEISKPFKTDFGYHLLKVDKIRGQKRDVRHILLIPEITSEVLKKYRSLADSLQKKLINKKIKFANAAKLYSDDKETRNEGGKLINPVSQDTRFELTKLDPILYSQVSDLEEGEISGIIPETDRKGEKSFKILTIAKRFEEHIADYTLDYTKIRDLALKEKKLNAVKKWQTEKIADTYIKINNSYKECSFGNNWLKK